MTAGSGCRAELLLGAVERQSRKTSTPQEGADGVTLGEAGGHLSQDPAEGDDETVPQHPYLQQRARYERDSKRLMDEASGAVMMAWEGPLMEAHAQAVCTTAGDILNVGFGLGLVDQVHTPRLATTPSLLCHLRLLLQRLHRLLVVLNRLSPRRVCSCFRVLMFDGRRCRAVQCACLAGAVCYPSV